MIFQFFVRWIGLFRLIFLFIAVLSGGLVLLSRTLHAAHVGAVITALACVGIYFTNLVIRNHYGY